ncbi:hypothetical protein COU79_00875 [Candidatus Peregrinibacteria bacterium CG10_big_fil_rev_8_21_14_0_10_54_7]|nr:MAG: hypothetical protein COU79_00875 [Candidatus Peregrinibacteria bacterium CG10_big_fil_rev_8_21_14_0_10_54_7]
MGAAVLEVPLAGQGLRSAAGELVDWRVSCFREPAGEALLDAVERRVRGLIQRFEPTVVAIESPSGVRLQMSPALGGLVARIRSAARGAGLRFVAVSPAEVRKRVCGSETATRKEMAEKLAERFEGLGRYCEGVGEVRIPVGRREGKRESYKVSSWQKEYWGPMFAAVGVGYAIVAGFE